MAPERAREPPERRIAASIAATGLPRAGHPRAAVHVPERHWDAVLQLLVRGSLTGLAVAGARSGDVELSDRQTAELLERHRMAMVLALEIERAMLDVCARFRDAGIEVVVLKGPGFAHLAYPDPAHRPFRDLDLLVRTEAWRDACRVLAELDYTRVRPEPRPGFDERFGKAATHVGDDRLWIDLHRTLVVGPFGLWLDPEGLFDRTEAFHIAGRRLPRLDTTMSLLHACLHASLGWWPPRLLPLRDVAQLAVRPEVDWDLLADRVEDWRLTAPVRDALGTAARVLDTPLPAPARGLMTTVPTRSERRALSVYRNPGEGRLGVGMATLLAIPGVRAKVAYVWALLVPVRRFVESRSGGSGLISYLRRWLRPVRWCLGRVRHLVRRLRSVRSVGSNRSAGSARSVRAVGSVGPERRTSTESPSRDVAQTGDGPQVPRS